MREGVSAMEVEEALDATSPQQVFAEYDDKGELDFDYGGMLEQEPETTPLHPASAAYEESPPPRLVARPQNSAKSHQGICPGLERNQQQEIRTRPADLFLSAVTSTPPCHSSALFSPATKCQHQSQAGNVAVLPQSSQQQQLSPALSMEYLSVGDKSEDIKVDAMQSHKSPSVNIAASWRLEKGLPVLWGEYMARGSAQQNL